MSYETSVADALDVCAICVAAPSGTESHFNPRLRWIRVPSPERLPLVAPPIRIWCRCFPDHRGTFGKQSPSNNSALRGPTGGGKPGSAATERDEIMEAWWLFSRAERTYVYSFSLYLPKDFPQTAERLVIAQWRQLCEHTCVPDNPILALRYELGRLQVTRNDEHGKTVLYQRGEDVRGRWLDFRFTARWDRTAKGAVDATLDGRGILNYEGATIYQPGSGHPRYALIYFKTGLYRDALHEPPWTMYVDEYRKDQCDGTGCR
jgi:hypothetical protein